MAMRTDDLIAHLSDGIDPVPSGTVARFLVAGLVAGIAVSVVLLVTTLDCGLILPKRCVAGPFG